MTTSYTTYTPNPVDLSSITLPVGLVALRELIAEHVHDLWSKQRISEGWTYGPKRDDDKKFHPCLLPYGDLPEGEREYDRITAEGTIKLILHMGYEFVTTNSISASYENP